MRYQIFCVAALSLVTACGKNNMFSSAPTPKAGADDKKTNGTQETNSGAGNENGGISNGDANSARGNTGGVGADTSGASGQITNGATGSTNSGNNGSSAGSTGSGTSGSGSSTGSVGGGSNGGSSGSGVTFPSGTAVSLGNCTPVRVSNATNCPANQVMVGLKHISNVGYDVSCCSLSDNLSRPLVYSTSTSVIPNSSTSMFSISCPTNHFITGMTFMSGINPSSVTCRQFQSASAQPLLSGAHSPNGILYSGNQYNCPANTFLIHVSDTNVNDIDTMRCAAGSF